MAFVDKHVHKTRFSLKTGFFTKQKKNHIKERFGHLLSAIRILNFTFLAQKTASTYTNNPTSAIQDAPFMFQLALMDRNTY